MLNNNNNKKARRRDKFKTIAGTHVLNEAIAHNQLFTYHYGARFPLHRFDRQRNYRSDRYVCVTHICNRQA